jgi:hypothetical protein
MIWMIHQFSSYAENNLVMLSPVLDLMHLLTKVSRTQGAMQSMTDPEKLGSSRSRQSYGQVLLSSGQSPTLLCAFI